MIYSYTLYTLSASTTFSSNSRQISPEFKLESVPRNFSLVVDIVKLLLLCLKIGICVIKDINIGAFEKLVAF